MQMLKEAIGSPRGLAICMDARQTVMVGVGEVFPEGEHRECMFHLVSNFKKRYHGKVFDENLWATAYSRNLYLFEKHWTRMEAAKPAATLTNYLRKCHTRLWARSQFSTNCKSGLFRLLFPFIFSFVRVYFVAACGPCIFIAATPCLVPPFKPQIATTCCIGNNLSPIKKLRNPIILFIGRVW